MFVVRSGVELGRAVPFAPALLLGILVRVLYVSVGGAAAARESLARQRRQHGCEGETLASLVPPSRDKRSKSSRSCRGIRDVVVLRKFKTSDELAN